MLSLVGLTAPVAVGDKGILGIGVHECEDGFPQHLLRAIAQHVRHAAIDKRCSIVAIDDPHALERGFDDTPIALFTGSECERGLFRAAHIARDAGGRNHVSVRVGEGCEADGDFHEAPVPFPTNGFELLDLLTAPDPVKGRPQFLRPVFRHDG